MRDNTLIHEGGNKLDKENKALKDNIKQYQVQIEEYQNQLELYAKVFKNMDMKIKSIESISKCNLVGNEESRKEQFL